MRRLIKTFKVALTSFRRIQRRKQRLFKLFKKRTRGFGLHPPLMHTDRMFFRQRLFGPPWDDLCRTSQVLGKNIWRTTTESTKNKRRRKTVEESGGEGNSSSSSSSFSSSKWAKKKKEMWQEDRKTFPSTHLLKFCEDWRITTWKLCKRVSAV